MQVLAVLFVVLGSAMCQRSNVNQVGGRYVFDLLKPALTAAEVEAVISSRDASYPTYDTIPETGFNCASQAQAGFYADTATNCQVFHRCDVNGNQTSYLCVNTTVFNQITLVCDYWYNVDCGRSGDFTNFANSRLYSDQPLFDTPPADYVVQNNGASSAQTATVQVSSVKASQRSDAQSQAANSGKWVFVSGDASSAGSSAATQQ